MASRAAPLPSNSVVDFQLLHPIAENPLRFLHRSCFVANPSEKTFPFATAGIPLLVDKVYVGTWASDKAFGRSLRTWPPSPTLTCIGLIGSRPPTGTCGKRLMFLTPSNFPDTVIGSIRCFWRRPYAYGRLPPILFSSIRDHLPRRCWTWPPSLASALMALFFLWPS